MTHWYSRPVLLVADLDAAIAFYVEKLGFHQDWRFADEGKGGVGQVSREGCELILSSHWPDKNDKGMIFISLDRDVLDAARKEFEANGVAVRDGWWGYDCAIVDDPDGNQLYFPYPNDKT